MAKDEKGRFYDRIESRVDLNPNHRAGLREAILTNQTLKALVYIEMLFEDLENKNSLSEKSAEKDLGNPAAKRTGSPKKTTARTKSTTKPKTTKSATTTSTSSATETESEDKVDDEK